MTFPKALIFGAIGTLTETSELQRDAFNRAFAEAGHDWHWDAATYRHMVAGTDGVVGGDTRIAAFAAVRGETVDSAAIAALHDAKSRIFQEAMLRDGLALNAGVDALLTEARSRGLRCVFASTTARANIDTMLRAINPGLARRFDLILSRDDVAAAKPAPDVYHIALTRLGLLAAEVIAIEDSAPSLAAAVSAGIATIVVPGKIWTGCDFAGARAVLSSLQEVTLTMLIDKAAFT